MSNLTKRFSDPSELASALPRTGVVLLDGDSGTGKSTLAKELAAMLDGVVVHGDDHFLSPDRARQAKAHRELVDFERLRGSLAGARLSTSPVVLDSVCAAWLAADLEVVPTAHVLVTVTDPRCARFDFGVDSLLTGPGSSLDERALLDDSVSEATIRAKLQSVPLNLLARSVLAYFKQAKPHRCATHFFTWPELAFRPQPWEQ